jgi:hypothetical protein
MFFDLKLTVLMDWGLGASLLGPVRWTDQGQQTLEYLDGAQAILFSDTNLRSSQLGGQSSCFLVAILLHTSGRSSPEWTVATGQRH